MHTKRVNDTLVNLKNRQLGAVIFVQDYVQLDFSHAMFTAHFYPTVRTPAGAFDILTPGYRDALCALIAKVVTDAYRLPGEKLVIEFEDTSLVEVSLKSEDQSEPEAATFYDSNKGFSVWRFGED